MSTVDTDGAAREASGAHPYGRYLEEFEVGAVYKHWPAKTVTEADDHLFCLLTMNHHPLHINDVYAAQSQQGKNVVVGPYVYSLALGMSVSDICGKAIANLATEELSHPAPVFHGDTLFAETEVLEVRSRAPSRPRHGQGPHARAEPGRDPCGRVQAACARSRSAKFERHWQNPLERTSASSGGVPGRPRKLQTMQAVELARSRLRASFRPFQGARFVWAGKPMTPKRGRIHP